jgi:hypothetical protein
LELAVLVHHLMHKVAVQFLVQSLQQVAAQVVSKQQILETEVLAVALELLLVQVLNQVVQVIRLPLALLKEMTVVIVLQVQIQVKMLVEEAVALELLVIMLLLQVLIVAQAVLVQHLV